MATFNVNADVTDAKEAITIASGTGTASKGMYLVVDDTKVDVKNSRQMEVLLQRIGERIRETMPITTA